MLDIILQESCKFFRDCLNVDMQPDDNVFENGANSLTIIKWSSFLAKKFGIMLDYRMLFEYQTIRSVIEHLDISICYCEEAALQEGNQEELNRAPLCSAQKGLWLHDRVYGTSDFVLCAYTRLEGKVDIMQLKKAISEVVSQNDIFSMHFAEDKAEGPYQYIDKTEGTLNIEQITLCDESEIESMVQSLKQEVSLEVPYKFWIASVGEKIHYIVYALHHIIADEETFEILNREIIEYYFSAGHLPKKNSYISYCKEKENEKKEISLSYWENQLTAEKVAKYVEFTRAQSIKSLEIKLSSDDVESLKEYALSQKTSLYVAFAGILAISLYLYSGKKRTFICSAISDRVNYPDHMDTCGMFVNNVLLESNIEYKLTYKDVIGQMACTFSDAMKYSNLAIDDMVRISDKIDGKYIKLQSDIVFNFIDFNRKSVLYNQMEILPLEYVVRPQNRINVYVQHINGEYVCNIDCWDQGMSLEDVAEIQHWIEKQLTEKLFFTEKPIIEY